MQLCIHTLCLYIKYNTNNNDLYDPTSHVDCRTSMRILLWEHFAADAAAALSSPRSTHTHTLTVYARFSGGRKCPETFAKPIFLVAPSDRQAHTHTYTRIYDHILSCIYANTYTGVNARTRVRQNGETIDFWLRSDEFRNCDSRVLCVPRTTNI